MAAAEQEIKRQRLVSAVGARLHVDPRHMTYWLQVDGGAALLTVLTLVGAHLTVRLASAGTDRVFRQVVSYAHPASRWRQVVGALLDCPSMGDALWLDPLLYANLVQHPVHKCQLVAYAADGVAALHGVSNGPNLTPQQLALITDVRDHIIDSLQQLAHACE